MPRAELAGASRDAARAVLCVAHLERFGTTLGLVGRDADLALLSPAGRHLPLPGGLEVFADDVLLAGAGTAGCAAAACRAPAAARRGAAAGSAAAAAAADAARSATSAARAPRDVAA